MQARLSQMIKTITVFATVFLFVLISIVCYQYAKVGTLSRKVQALDNKIASLSVTKSKLENGIETRCSDAYIEQQARENLGMIKVNGEKIYIFD